jgi:molecular chaperone HtpG
VPHESIRRRWIREFELQDAAAQDKLAVIAQGSLGEAERSQVVQVAERALATMEKIAGMEAFALKPDDPLHITVREVRAELQRRTGAAEPAPPLSRLSPEKRAMYEHFFALICKCSTNRVAAKALVDRIVLRLE